MKIMLQIVGSRFCFSTADCIALLVLLLLPVNDEIFVAKLSDRQGQERRRNGMGG